MLEDHLLAAASNGFDDRVELLLAHGVDPDGEGSRHPVWRVRSPLGHAIHAGAARSAELLRAAGATRSPSSTPPSGCWRRACAATRPRPSG